MVTPEIYTSQFSNRYGEEWEFAYDLATGEGILRGSDVDWEEYLVVEGKAPTIDRQKTTGVATVDLEFLKAIPVVNRGTALILPSGYS